MPGPLAVAAVAGSVISTGSSIIGGFLGADEKKKVAKEQARLTYNTRMEEIRRTQRDTAFIEGEALATSYAANLMHTGSTKGYINDLKNEHLRNRVFAQNAAEKERELIKRGGQSPGLGIETLGKAAGGISSAIGAYKGATA